MIAVCKLHVYFPRLLACKRSPLLQVAETGISVPERPRLRQLLKSFSTGTRGAEKMHNVKENMKQLLMPWKRKLAEAGGEEMQNNDDFGTHPVLQV